MCKSFCNLLFIMFILIGNISLSAQISCDDSGVPAFNPQPCTSGNHVGSLISTRDPGENFLSTVIATDSGGGDILLVNDGTEYCDENGLTGFSTEGPDLNIEIQVPVTKRSSCASATLSITLRGDFNNSCEVAYIVNECDVIIAQSLLTGLPESDKCDIIFPLSVMIPAADMAEAAADGVINFQIRTPSFNPNCCQGSDVDATCGGGTAPDCNGDGNRDGNCLAFASLEWPITTAVYGGTLNSTNEVVCPGESVEIDVLQDLLFVDPVGLGDGNDNTGTYHLDFYYGGGPNPPNPYDTNLGGTAGDVVNAYTVNGVSQNPQVNIVNMGGVGVQDHSNTNAPLASGGGDLPSNTLIEVVGSVWVDGDIEPSAAGFCTGDIIGCTFTTSYVSFVLLDPITATATCQPCGAGPGNDTNIGVVTISGFDGGLPDYDDTLYELQATGGTLSSTTADVGGSVTLTLDPNQHNWSVTILDDEGCEHFLSGNCGIDILPEINMPSFVCVDAGTITVSTSPAGGTLSGPGISGSTFDPFTAGTGQHTITYTITEAGCTAVEELDIFVDACSGCSDPTTSITCNINYVTQDNNLNIDGGSYNTLDDGAGGICGRPIGTTDLCLFNVFIDKCGDVDLIAKFTDNTLDPNDIDAYVWGPFDNLPDEITDLTPANNIVCQPDVATTEGVPFSIDCAEVGMFYVIGVADFTGEGGGNNVFIGQTNVTEAGAGAILGCTVPDPILTADDVSVCQGETISVVVNSDNVPFTCEGTLTIYEDPNGITEAGTSGSLTLAPGCYEYYVACVPTGDCVCELDYIPVKIFVDDLVTIPMTMNIDNACGDYSQVTSETITYNQQVLFPGSDPGGQLSVSVLDDQTGAAITNVVDEYVKIDGAGCYEVEYTIGADQCGGPNTETTYIRRTISPEPNFTIQDQVCLPSNSDTDGVILTPTVNSPGAAYDALVERTWSIVEVGSGAAFADLSVAEVELTEEGTYTLRLTETISYDACGALAAGSCSATFDVDIVVQAGESLDPSFTADQTACPGESIALDPTVDGGVFTGQGVTDNGSGTGGTFSATNPGEYVVTYTLESSNGCTNAYSLIITVDETSPVMNCPADLTVECGAGTMESDITNWINGVTATDDCDMITVDSELIQTVEICGASGYRVYEFTAEDNSGNTTSCTANVIMEDTSDPELTQPADITVECGTLISSAAGGPQTINAWLEAVSATDDCSDEFVFTNNYVSNGFTNTCGDAGTQSVTFVVADECGNSDEAMSTITIVDSTPPVIMCAADITLQCGDVNNAAIVNNWLNSPMATDNCGDVSVSNDFTALPTTCNQDVTVTFTVVGNCDGMTVTCSATISIVDSEKPVIMTVPTDLIVECDGTADPSGAIAAWLIDAGGMIVTDNCDTNPEIAAQAGTSVDNCGSTTTTPYTFTAEDECGNTISEVANLIIQDTTAPTLTAPTAASVTCENEDVSTWANTVSATDVGTCNTVTTNFALVSETTNCAAGGWTTIYTYTFTAEDACNNAATPINATYTVVDDEAPVFAPAADLTLSCGDDYSALILSWTQSISATDNCNSVSITNDYDGSLPEECGDATGVSVTFTATDGCLTSTLDLNIIQSVENTPPTIQCPADLTLECNDASNPTLIDNWLALASGSDTCGDVVVTNNFTSMLNLDCASASGTLVTFTATDDCDNTATCTASIILIDEEDPTILNFPIDKIVECDASNLGTELTDWLENIGGASAIDNCDTDLMWSSAAQAVDSQCGNTSITPYIFTVTDACGNTATALANFITEDTSAPSLVVPTDLTTVECDGAGNTAALNSWLATVSGSDTCSDDVEITTILENTISGCGDTQTLVYRFTVEDDCGNTRVGHSTFVIEDTDEPMITCPASDLALECGNPNNINLVAAWLSTVTASDDCSGVSITNNFVAIPTDLACNGGSVTITFTATDDCGNVETCDADITVNDTQAPTFLACPSDLTLNTDGECGNTPVFSAPVAIDHCDVTVAQTDGMPSGTPLALGMHTIEYTATDACGLTATCSWTITVVDVEAPLVLCPSSDVVRCVNTDPCEWTSDASVAPSIDIENCPGYSIVYAIGGDTPAATGNTDATGEVFMLGTSTVTYTITDGSGNTSSCTFNVVVEDCQAPTITSCPADITVTCGDATATSISTWQSTAMSTDLCDSDVDITALLFNTISGCSATSTEVYLFTATDDAGNTTTCLSSYTIEDISMPSIVCPAETLVLECGNPQNDALIADWLATASATDGCNTPTLTHNFAVLPTDLVCEGGGSVTVTFTAEDECGNISTCPVDITINDTQAPVFTSCPANITLNTDGECGATPIFSTPTATDNCEVVVTQTSMLGSGDEFPLGMTTVEFTATDRCGLTATCSWTITVVDVAGPLVFCPSTDVVKCVDEGICTWTSDIDVSPRLDLDNCPYTVTYNVTGQTTASGDDDASGVVFNLGTSTVSYTITDSSNNTSTCSFDVVVEDCEVPVLTCADDITVSCGDPMAMTVAAWQATATATDNCNMTASVTAELYNTISGCGATNTEVYLFTATDIAGNTSTCLASYTIEDTTLPDLVCPVATLELECGDANNDNLIAAWLATATATDNCDAPVITHNYVAPPLGFTCEGF